jgi:hypothetical protein
LHALRLTPPPATLPQSAQLLADIFSFLRMKNEQQYLVHKYLLKTGAE